jgi:Tol biopolymer transport system component
MLRYFPQWMPDGRRIVFGRSELDKAGKEINETIVEFDLQSGKERDLFRGEMDPRSLSVSPDGQFLAGIHIDIVRKQSSLLLIPIPAGQPVRELLRLDQFGGQFTTWTPNGASLLFTKDNQDIQAIETWIVSLATGQKKLIDLGGYVGHRGVRVQPGGEQLVFWLPAVAQVRAMENSPPAPAANK